MRWPPNRPVALAVVRQNPWARVVVQAQPKAAAALGVASITRYCCDRSKGSERSRPAMSSYSSSYRCPNHLCSHGPVSATTGTRCKELEFATVGV